jgi:hypothetical protein
MRLLTAKATTCNAEPARAEEPSAAIADDAVAQPYEGERDEDGRDPGAACKQPDGQQRSETS